jgi:fluoroquinolone transport system permease protein
VTNALVFSDTSILGLTFVGAILLLEKGQNLLQGLFVTPVRLFEYLTAKVISLALIALLASAAILIIPNGFVPSLGLFLPGVFLTSCIFTLIGLAVGARFQTMNGFLFGTMAGTMIFSAPLIAYFDIYDGVWLYAFPTRATLLLLASTFQDISAGQLVYAFLNLLIWNTLAWLLASWSFRRHILGER